MEYGRCAACGSLRNLSRWYLDSVTMGCATCGSIRWKPTYRLTWRERGKVALWQMRENVKLNRGRWWAYPACAAAGVWSALRHNPREDRAHAG